MNWCGQYDALPETDRPAGETVQFGGWIPYGGLALSGVVDLPVGFHAAAAYQRSVSVANVFESSPSSTSQSQLVRSVDQRAQVSAAWVFALSPKLALGPAIGGELHFFEVDPNANVSLTSSRRIFPWLGASGRWTGWKRLEIDGGARLLLFTMPGAQEREAFGSPVVSFGLGGDVSAHGPLWKWLDYSARFDAEWFRDRFLSSGARWPAVRYGAAQELYLAVVLGTRASF